MSDKEVSSLNIRKDRSTTIASSAYGSIVDAVAFNVTFLASRNPKLAVEVMKLYDLARQVKESDPKAPDEDFALYADEVRKTFLDSSDN